jgi:short-subunit dehydrogenase
MPTPSSEARVIVITGASSGIGRATALAFAEHKDALVLVGRDEGALAEVVAACERLGGRAFAVVADVSEPDAMTQLAKTAIARLGRIDVWINNAGVGAIGAFDTTPMAAHQQVVETDLLAYMRGAHAIVPHFKVRERGTLINVLSIGAWTPAPYAAAYSAAKFGLRGFTEALRGELSRWRDIHVCDVHPSFVDTPGLAHGANYVGREVKPPPGVVPPEAVATAIVRLADHPRRQVVVGRGVTAMARLARMISPRATSWGMARVFETWFAIARPIAKSSGNLFIASRGHDVRGGWIKPGQRGLVVAVGLAAAAGLSLWLARSRAARAWKA